MILSFDQQWNNDGYENAKRFHGKFDMVSPVWLTINSKDPFKIPTHDLQKLWLHDMKAADNENHTTKSKCPNPRLCVPTLINIPDHINSFIFQFCLGFYSKDGQVMMLLSFSITFKRGIN